jgi:hypothetical protein
MARTIQMVAAVSGYKIAMNARMIISVHMLSDLLSMTEQMPNVMVEDIPADSNICIVLI